MNARHLLLLLLVPSTLLLQPSAFPQGSLTPPGPPAATMRSLDQVEPRAPISSLPVTINKPGAYFLTGNLTGTSGDGITIASDNVMIDLRGFTLSGGPEGVDGIAVDGAHYNVVVENGTVTKWSGDGINFNNARNSQVRNVQVSGNGDTGISLGSFSQAAGCVADSNDFGFDMHDGCGLSRCVASSNFQSGILTGNYCTVDHCVGGDNGAVGIDASLGNVVGGNVISNCIAYVNGTVGIRAGTGSQVHDCASNDNGGTGMLVEGGVLVQACAVRSCNAGIDASTGSVITGCAVSFCTTDGIIIGSDCLVIGNNCYFNGHNGDGAGVHATGVQNRIDGNKADSNDRGFDVDNINNLIIRNSASGNTTNYDIVANNKVAFTTTMPNSGAILGNNGGAGVGTSEPLANFSH
jgi:hypothetical protein